MFLGGRLPSEPPVAERLVVTERAAAAHAGTLLWECRMLCCGSAVCSLAEATHRQRGNLRKAVWAKKEDNGKHHHI